LDLVLDDYRQSILKLAIFVINTPFPTFPYGGRSRKQSSPLRWNGKGDIIE